MTNGQAPPPPAPPPPPVYAPPVPQWEPVSGGIKILLYLICFFLGIPIGTIIGVIFYINDNPYKKQVGKTCIILSVVGLVLVLLCVFVLGVGMLFAF